MNNSASVFFERLKDKKVAFVGLGVSHRETIQFFARQGIKTIAMDKRPPDQHDPKLLEKLESLGVELMLGDYDLLETDADVLMRTPGMYYFQPEITAFHQLGGIVTSEMELFCELCPCPVIAVTGSDGKTTTTTIIAEMLSAQGKTVHLGGNIGRALLPIIYTIKPEDFAVVELSSFQLISMRPSPDVAVVTNVMPNHLDIHSSMEEYITAKRNIYSHQTAFSYTVLNQDNDITNSFEKDIRGELATFSLEKKVNNGAYLKDETLVLADFGKEIEICTTDDIKLPGIHNIANYLTAIAAMKNYVSPKNMAEVAKSFGGVEHRIELVRNRNGVRWYNDSIASSPSRAIAGIRALSGDLILIAGGYDKNIPYEPMAPEIIEHVKTLIVMGDSGPKIEAVVKNHPDYKQNKPVIIQSDSMEQSVQLAAENSKANDKVILSPASASFDFYKNFEHRGKHFKELVNNLD